MLTPQRQQLLLTKRLKNQFSRMGGYNMSLNLMYITNNPQIAKIAENSGVDWIFIDLEINGKEDRQGHLDTVISNHELANIREVKSVLKKSKLLVRINPIFKNSKEEINQVIQNGADIVMLPFFKTKLEVEQFIKLVNNRAKVCLLLETPEAVECLDDILSLKGIDYIHIGLNDLHLGYKKNFMFELLIDGTVEEIANKVKKAGIQFGFGGIARLGTGELGADVILAEHYRLKSELVILSRSFCNYKTIKEISQVKDIFDLGVKGIRQYEERLMLENDDFFIKNYSNMKEKITNIIKEKEMKNV